MPPDERVDTGDIYMATQWANQAKAGLELRLDPCHLPQSVAYLVDGRTMICSLTDRGASLKVDDGNGAQSLSRLIPAHHFKGIAARAVVTATGHKAVSLELLHKDAEACIPLLVSRDMDDVLLDWRLWADTYDLPMILINEDGSATRVQERSPLQHFFAQKQREQFEKKFLLRCRGCSLGIRLVIANQVMLG